jgi:hypothetical protein
MEAAMNYSMVAVLSFSMLVPAAHAETLPNPMVVQAPQVIPTLDGGGSQVGRLSSFVLTLSRQYTPQNQLSTPWHLDYFYGNGNAGETQGGSQIFTIDLLDKDGNVLVKDLIGNLNVPRYKCWYGGGSPQKAEGTINFDDTNKDITGIRINVSRVSGSQGKC